MTSRRIVSVEGITMSCLVILSTDWNSGDSTTENG